VTRPACTATARHGQRCRAFSLPGEPFCRTHHPDRAEDVRASRARGAKVRAIMGRRPRLDQPRALAAFLSNLIHDLAEGKVDGDLARTIAYACSVQRGVVELAQKIEIEARLAEVEKLLAARRTA
jgi:urease gamma subunit